MGSVALGVAFLLREGKAEAVVKRLLQEPVAVRICPSGIRGGNSNSGRLQIAYAQFFSYATEEWAADPTIGDIRAPAFRHEFKRAGMPASCCSWLKGEKVDALTSPNVSEKFKDPPDEETVCRVLRSMLQLALPAATLTSLDEAKEAGRRVRSAAASAAREAEREPLGARVMAMNALLL